MLIDVRRRQFRNRLVFTFSFFNESSRAFPKPSVFLFVLVMEENFTQAVEDFQSALDLKSPILPFSSRHISEAHLKLAMALEFAPSVADHRARALSHVERSKASLVERRAELESGQSAFSVLSEGDDKGKAKATEGVVLDQDVVKDRVEKLSAKEREDEVREIDEMMEDLDVKVRLRFFPCYLGSSYSDLFSFWVFRLKISELLLYQKPL